MNPSITGQGAVVEIDGAYAGNSQYFLRQHVVIHNAEQKVERLALHEPLEILPGIRTGQATPLGPAQ